MSQIKCDFDKFNSFRPKLSIFDIFKEIITIWAKLSKILISSIFSGSNFQSLGNYNDLSPIKYDFDTFSIFKPKLSIFDIFKEIIAIWAKWSAILINSIGLSLNFQTLDIYKEIITIWTKVQFWKIK